MYACVCVCCFIGIKLCCRTRLNASGHINIYIGNVRGDGSLLGARGGGVVIRERFLRDPGKRYGSTTTRTVKTKTKTGRKRGNDLL